MDDRNFTINEAYGTTGQQVDPGMVEFAKEMIQDPTIPPEMRKMFWGFINKETILSRSDTRDRKRSENRFAIIRNFYLMSQPQYRVNITQLMEVQNAQHRNTVETNRSFDGFERQALTTQIKELRTPNIPKEKGGSFLSGIKKKFGLGGREEEHASIGR